MGKIDWLKKTIAIALPFLTCLVFLTSLVSQAFASPNQYEKTSLLVKEYQRGSKQTGVPFEFSSTFSEYSPIYSFKAHVKWLEERESFVDQEKVFFFNAPYRNESPVKVSSIDQEISLISSWSDKGNDYFGFPIHKIGAESTDGVLISKSLYEKVKPFLYDDAVINLQMGNRIVPVGLSAFLDETPELGHLIGTDFLLVPFSFCETNTLGLKIGGLLGTNYSANAFFLHYVKEYIVGKTGRYSFNFGTTRDQSFSDPQFEKMTEALLREGRLPISPSMLAISASLHLSVFVLQLSFLSGFRKRGRWSKATLFIVWAPVVSFLLILSLLSISDIAIAPVAAIHNYSSLLANGLIALCQFLALRFIAREYFAQAAIARQKKGLWYGIKS